MTLKRVYLTFQAFEPRSLLFGLRRVRKALEMVPGLRQVMKQPHPLPTVTRKVSVQKSPFVHKKAHRTLEQSYHRRLVIIEGDSSITNKFIRYLRANIDVSLAVRVKEHSYYPTSKFFSFSPNLLKNPRQ
jgi:ribosomal protein S10